MKYPNSEQIKKMLEDSSDDDFVRVIDASFSKVDKTKYELCKKFSVYLREQKLSQAELARRLDIDRSRINWIVKYKIENFTIDKLFELWGRIQPDDELQLTGS